MSETPATLPANFFDKHPGGPPPDTLPADFFGADEAAQEVPDAAKQAHEKMQQTPMTRSALGGAYPSKAEEAQIEKHLPEVKPFARSVQKGALEIGGSMAGGALGEFVSPAAKAAGGSGFMKWLLPTIARSGAVGGGAGAGALVGGASPREALGTSAGFAGMEAGTEGVVGLVGKTRPFVRDLLKSRIQRMEEEHQAKAAEAYAAHQEKVEAHRQAIKQVEQEHKQALEASEAEHAQEVEKHRQAIKLVEQTEKQKAAEAEAAYQKELQAHQQKVSEIKADYQKKAEKFQTAESLKRQQKQLGTTVGENIKLADKKVSNAIGKEFAAVNEAVEKKAPPVKLTDVSKSARSDLVFPDSVKAFNNILKNLGETTKSGSFSEMRMAYTRLNEILFGGNELPTDLYRAVKTVRDSLGRDLTEAAKSVGEGEKYGAAMKKWSEYMEDWHDTTAIAKGGSPISRIVQAEDPQFVIDQFGGKANERLLRTLEKYKGYGVDTELAGQLQSTTGKLKGMSIPKEPPEAPRVPAPPERKAESTFTKIPRPPMAPTPESAVSIPTPPVAPEIAPFDRQAAARQILIDRIRKALIGGGAVGGYELLRHLLSSKSSGRDQGLVP